MYVLYHGYYLDAFKIKYFTVLVLIAYYISFIVILIIGQSTHRHTIIVRCYIDINLNKLYHYY